MKPVVQMTRRIIRTLVQVTAFIILTCILIFLADSRYRVLPDRIHSALPSHHTGSIITDVTIIYCATANPFRSCRLEHDNWQRVEKDLYLGNGWVWEAYLHVQRHMEEELSAEDQVVMDVKISKSKPPLSEKEGKTEAWESRPGDMWILKSSRRHDSDSNSAVTAIDVLFGTDAVEPRPNWELSRLPLSEDHGEKGLPARLSIRRGRAKTDHQTPPPRVRKDGKFKILQISDAHLATGLGTCRDAIGVNNLPSKQCDADPRTLEFVEKVLDDEKPDMVVLSGDQVEGPAAPDTQTAILKMTAPLIERSIPYAAIFGNHDDEGHKSMPRKNQMALLQTLPFSLSQPGPADIPGVGNYFVEVLAHGVQHSALTLYMLDTHSLTPDEKKYRGYDWIKQPQIDWFTNTAQGLKKEHSKYSHIHMDMAFIHIPLPEYADKANQIAGGRLKEGVTAPAFNSHFYDALVEEGVVAVGCGHDHVNDYCALHPHADASRDEAAKSENDHHPDHHLNRKARLGPWMCYAGGSGFGGYAGYDGGTHRRVRVWELDTNAGRLSTWKRLECCLEDTEKRVDELVLVDGGSVIAPP